VDRICYMLMRTKAKYPQPKEIQDTNISRYIFICVFFCIEKILCDHWEYTREYFVFMKSNIRYNIRSSVAHLAHMTAACFTKFLSPLYQFREIHITRKRGSKLR